MLASLLLLAAQAPAPKLWDRMAPRLKLEYRFVIKGEAGIERGEPIGTLDYEVDRQYGGTIVLDMRTEGSYPRARPMGDHEEPKSKQDMDRANVRFTNWDFAFNQNRKDPLFMMTTDAKVSVRDQLTRQGKLVQSWTAEHAARPVMTEAMIDLDQREKNFDLVFGVGDQLGVTDAVMVTIEPHDLENQTLAITLPSKSGETSFGAGLTQIPGFSTAKDEVSQWSVTLPKLTNMQFERKFKVTRAMGIMAPPPISGMPWRTADWFKNRSITITLRVKITPLK